MQKNDREAPADTLPDAYRGGWRDEAHVGGDRARERLKMADEDEGDEGADVHDAAEI